MEKRCLSGLVSIELGLDGAGLPLPRLSTPRSLHARAEQHQGQILKEFLKMSCKMQHTNYQFKGYG